MHKTFLICCSALAGLFVFVALSSAQDSLNVRRLAQFSNPTPYDVAIAGNHAYVASWGSGVGIYYIWHPNYIQQVRISGSPPC